MTSHLLVVVALGQERRTLRSCLRPARRRRLDGFPAVFGQHGRQPVVLMQSGLGAERARQAVLTAARRLPLHSVWSVGFAGGLIDGLRPGDLVCPTCVLEQDGRRAEHIASPASAPSLVCAAIREAGIAGHVGRLLTTAAPLRTPEAKRAAHGGTGAVAVDMEAAGVAAAARELRLPWCAIKAILDPVALALPPALAACTTPGGRLCWRGLLAFLLAGREERSILPQMARAAGQARRALRRGIPAALTAWAALTTPPLSSRM